jgi:hypothetical protein
VICLLPCYFLTKFTEAVGKSVRAMTCFALEILDLDIIST